MNSKIFLKALVIQVLFFQFSIFAYSQKQNYTGINFTCEWTSHANVRNGIGLLIERQFLRHHGMESGLYVRTFSSDFIQTINANDYLVNITQYYLSLPLLYKFYSKVLNFEIGPNFDYFVGWHQTNDNSAIKVKDYSIKPKMFYGLVIKVSKPIQLGEKFLVEPEIRYNPILKYTRYYLGIGIAAKYKF